MRTFLAVVLLLLPFCTSAQSPGSSKRVKMRFHVTSVRYEDDPDACPIPACYAKKSTVEGVAEGSNGIRTAYVLRCDEMTAMEPKPHVTLSCGSVHANFDYEVILFSSGFSFWPDAKYTPPPLHGVYDIVSERELSKGH